MVNGLRFQRFHRMVVLSGVLVFAAGILHANERVGKPAVFLPRALDDWNLSLSNSLRTEYYHFSGDASASPYRHQGTQPYDEFNLGFHQQNSPYDFWRGQVSGVLNGSDYRSSDNGFVPERINLFREKGDVSLPYRLEAGDLYGFFSYRTLQRSLKGVQMELQPAGGGPGTRHSLVILAGADQPSWRHFDADENLTGGLSYLLESPRLGRCNFNFVYNSRKRNRRLGTLDRHQQTWSLAGEKILSFGSQWLTMEGELGFFNGDHDGISGPASGRDRSGWGGFLQATGKSRSPLTYRFRYEAYGQDYRPAGAATTPDRQSVDFHAGWRFAGGLEMRGRVQRFRDNWKTANPQDTRILGMSASGPIALSLIRGGNASLDMFLQQVDDQLKTVDQGTRSLNLNAHIPLYAGWNNRLGLSYLDVDPKNTPSSTTRQLTFAVDHGTRFRGVAGSLSPSLVLRKAEGPGGESRDLDLGFAAQLAGDPHNLGFDLSYNLQPRDDNPDVRTFSYAFNYRYSARNDILGIEYRSDLRNPDPGEKTDSFRLRLFWTHSLDKPQVLESRPSATRFAWAEEGGVAAEEAGAPMEFQLAELAPGMGMDAVIKRLDESHIRGPIEQGNLLIFETRPFEEIDQRQRLVLVRAGGRLRQAAVIVDLPGGGIPPDFMQLFERVRKLLIDRYGRPTDVFDKGEAGPDLAARINNGTFVRLTEWSLPGGTLRFGIPGRLDRTVRMEVQFARQFPPVADFRWSLEAVK